MKKIGLYFGTFNPIHIGHLIIANHFAEFTDLNEVWFVVTPHSPLKKKHTLLNNYHRLEMVTIATENYDNLKPSNIEFNLPQPNYTINTLTHLNERYPENNFVLIMGEDNLTNFHKWKNHEIILENYNLYIYPRIDQNSTLKNNFQTHPKVHKIAAPIIEISATFIRNSIAKKKDIRPLLPHKVWKYIDLMNFYN